MPAKSNRNDMPSVAAIRKFWSKHASKLPTFDSATEVLEADICFACGCSRKVERCHIIALSDGGSNAADNLHLLCRVCHKSSERMQGDTYWKWLRNRSTVDMVVQTLATNGVNVWSMMAGVVDNDQPAD